MSKYFKYAIGEILLVVIGILIALQINNWNQEKQEQERVKAYMINLGIDLNQDIEEIQFRIKSIRQEAMFIDDIADYFRSKSIKDLDNLEAFYQSFDYYGYRPFNWYKSTIEELRNSGSLKSIRNDSIRLMINKYYALTDHLDQDYKEDHQLSEQINNKYFKIVNINYPRRQDLIDTLFLSYVKKDKYIFMNSEVYKVAKALDLQLLTKDMNDVNNYINELLRYKGSLTIRYSKEFPKLIDMGETILRLIDEEYNIKTND
jgi:hypothetical protein